MNHKLRPPGEKNLTVLIIGGGIAGLTTALALQRAGLSVTSSVSRMAAAWHLGKAG